MTVKISLRYEEIAAFCQRWQIAELAFFGSVLRDDFRPESDVDVLVTFAPGVEWSLLSEGFRTSRPTIPWRMIAGMRDQLIQA
jgi:predicted nucleotidyltransferase